MAAPNQPPETALPLVVAEAERWRYDLQDAPLGQLVVARAADIEMPTLAAVTLRPPLDLRHGEFQAIDLTSKGLPIAGVMDVLDVSERQVHALLAGARRRVGARTNEQATRSYMDMGLLTPLQRSATKPPERLSTSEFVTLGLMSRGWKTDDIARLDGGGRSTINTFAEIARFRLDRARNNEHATRRALSIGSLAFDRTLVSA
jgi:DNA-binding CsgD family transcriptional regulator